jgi:hypothetical protein
MAANDSQSDAVTCLSLGSKQPSVDDLSGHRPCKQADLALSSEVLIEPSRDVQWRQIGLSAACPGGGRGLAPSVPIGRQQRRHVEQGHGQPLVEHRVFGVVGAQLPQLVEQGVARGPVLSVVNVDHGGV